MYDELFKIKIQNDNEFELEKIVHEILDIRSDCIEIVEIRPTQYGCIIPFRIFAYQHGAIRDIHKTIQNKLETNDFREAMRDLFSLLFLFHPLSLDEY